MHRVIRNGLALGLVSALAFTLSPISPVSAATKKPAAKPAAKKPAAKPAAKKAATPTVLRMTRMGDWSNAFGPSRNSSGTDHLVNFMLFDNLVKIAKDEKTILPALATKWTISKDAKKFTFELRKGVKFHDGSTFNAEDVAETVGFNCRLNVKNYIGYAPALWAAVDGCAEMDTKLTGIPSGVKVIDDYNIEINITKGNAVWLRGLTDAVYSIIPKEVHSGLSFKEFKESDFVIDEPIGTGPYTLAKFKRNAYLEFAANPNYYGGKPKIDKVFLLVGVAQTNVLPMLQKGELDLAIDVDATMEEQVEKLSTHTPLWNNTTGARYFQFRNDHPTFGDKRVRQAFLYAFDYRTYLKTVLKGKGDIRWMFPAFDQNRGNLNKYEYDPAKAKALLKESGADLSKPYKINVLAGDPGDATMSVAVKQALEAVGMKVELNVLENAAWANETRIAKATADTWALTFNSGGSLGLGTSRGFSVFNCVTPIFSFYAKCDIPDLYAKLMLETDPKEQDKLEDALAKIINDEVPFYTPWIRQTFNVVSKKLGGTFALYPNDRDSTMGITGWTMAK
jgi:ABC-type transport system substrate-binding protein